MVVYVGERSVTFNGKRYADKASRGPVGLFVNTFAATKGGYSFEERAMADATARAGGVERAASFVEALVRTGEAIAALGCGTG